MGRSRMADRKKAEKSKLRLGIETLVFWAAFVWAIYYGTILVLTWLNGGNTFETTSEEGFVMGQPYVFDTRYETMEDPYLADLMAAFEVVRARWSYEEYRTEEFGLDMAALEQEARGILGEEPTPHSFRLAMRHAIAGLMDGHAFVAFPQELAMEGQRWPFSLKQVMEGFMVTGVAEVRSEDVEPTPPQKRPVPGDILVAIDGRPTGAWVEDAEKQVFASTDRSRAAEALRYLVTIDQATTRRFTFLDGEGTEYHWDCTLPPFYRAVPPAPRVSREREHKMLEDGIGYFRPGSFSPPSDSGWPGPPEGRDAILADSYAEIDAIIGELAEARALILDLRNNPGGTDLLGMFLVDRLVKGSYTYYRLSGDGKNGFKGFAKHGSTAPKGEHAFHGKLLVLVDEHTFSTADNVAACLEKVHPEVTFVGRPNGAGTGAPRSFTLPRTGTTVTLCTMRVQNPDGEIAEGHPVRVLVTVGWTRGDVLEGRDPDLEIALRELKN